MTEIDELYEIAKRNLSDLVEDIRFINTNISDEQIICPTCDIFFAYKSNTAYK